MDSPRAFSIEISGPFSSEKVCDAAMQIRKGLGRPATVAVAFVSSDYIKDLPEFVETLRVDGHITEVIGCTGRGFIVDARESESAQGCSILALTGDVGTPFEWSGTREPDDLPEIRPRSAILLSNPFQFATDQCLGAWNTKFPGSVVVGGLASGKNDQEATVFRNDREVAAVCLPQTGRIGLLPLVSQGCRPIGEPLTVTRAENNIIYALGGQSAYEVLESAFETLSDKEKSVAKGNLFAGIVGDEYLEDFKPGDFVIRNIIGADPGSGAVVIAGLPRTGQTVQYQLRDREIAEADLERVLGSRSLHGVRPFATLLFLCQGRGSQFFGSPHHDARRFFTAGGGAPLAGFFCNAEIAPVTGRNELHGYTAAAGLLVENLDET